MPRARIGIVGLGAMGKGHLRSALATPNAIVVAVADPSEAAEAHAKQFGVKYYRDYTHMIGDERLDGVIVSVPNADHASVGHACIDNKIAVLIEKPIAESVQSAKALCEAASARSVPILVGHHRRHNGAVQIVRRAVQDGLIGRPVTASIFDLKLKPDSYFQHAWRTAPEAGGPILINLIHEIDLMRHIFGEVESLQAISSNAVRGLQVEDTALVMMTFANGALGTLALSDTTTTPFSWDLASGELDVMAGTTGTLSRQDVSTHIFAGTRGSLTLPKAHYFNYEGRGEPGWLSQLSQTTLGTSEGDTYATQMAHFSRVCLRQEEPLVSGLDGARTLEVTLAVRESARTGRRIQFEKFAN